MHLWLALFDIDRAVLENIDIDKEILENIDIDKILNRLEFGISKVFSESKILDALILNFFNAEMLLYIQI